jgi:DNA-binding response OmpR family regulator
MQPILLADDDENGAFLAVRAFKQAGVTRPVVVVHDGEAVVQYLSGTGRYADRGAHPMPCMLLLDQKLPGRSGLEVLQWVRTKSNVVTLPVLLLSASGFDGDVQTAYLLGANGYVVKPSAYEEMLAVAKAVKDYWLTVNRFPEPSPG